MPQPSAPPEGPGRMIGTRGGNDRHIRHASLLARWPVLAEPWAEAIERTADGAGGPAAA